MQESRAPQKKSHLSRRVSYRRELAVVTLGMVASIAGVGGILSAGQPGSVAPSQKGEERPALNTPLAFKGNEERILAPRSTAASKSVVPPQTAPSAVSQGS